jgi:hypothetical protein
MLFKETVAGYCEKYTEHTNTREIIIELDFREMGWDLVNTVKNIWVP